LKLWVTLLRYGAEGIGELFDYLCDTTRDLYEAVKAHRAFISVHEPECNILCFRYVGPTAAGSSPGADDLTGETANRELDETNRALRERYNRSGHGWITTTVLDGQQVLRATIMNPRTTSQDVRDVLDGLAALAANE
jgi:L-2,4-diaminobutyrate decarboxylase